MAVLALKVLDKNGRTLCVSSGEDQVSLVCTAEYQEGDRVVLETSEKNIHVWLQEACTICTRDVQEKKR